MQPTGHELALHGVTHVPWGTVDAAFIEGEARIHEQLCPELRGAQTFVYPRNDIAHVTRLPKFGIDAYRLARSRSRVASLASEFAILTAPDRDPPSSSGPVGIPAGHFVNWRHGARRAVPAWLSVLRARQMLERASAEGGVVHYWLHPENVATAPATLDVLRGILHHVARLREAGRCRVMTQLDYFRDVTAAKGAREAA
jgi:peptidoglycan/xylan/chitin deacetylase (PgdA/CDA1 family)